jgi:hypothetical protein
MDPLQDYFDRLIAVDDLEDHLAVDKFLAHTKHTDNSVQMSLNQIFLMHQLLVTNQTTICTPQVSGDVSLPDPMLEILKKLGPAPAQVKNVDNRVVLLSLIDHRKKRMESSNNAYFSHRAFRSCAVLICDVYCCDFVFIFSVAISATADFSKSNSTAKSSSPTAASAPSGGNDNNVYHPVFTQTRATLLTILRSLPVQTDQPGLLEFLTSEKERFASVQPATAASKTGLQNCETAMRAVHHLLVQGVWTPDPNDPIEVTFNKLMVKFSEVTHKPSTRTVCGFFHSKHSVCGI